MDPLMKDTIARTEIDALICTAVSQAKNKVKSLVRRRSAVMVVGHLTRS